MWSSHSRSSSSAENIMATKENSIFADPLRKPELEPGLYNLHGERLDFFKLQTGIQDEAELKTHILDVQAKAYAIFGYPCIRLFTFLQTGISRLPGYRHALSLLDQYQKPLLLDIGCCFGVDMRKAVADGWPADDIIACDIEQGFWDFGHLLFKSTPQSFPVRFFQGDILDPNFLQISHSSLVDPKSPTQHEPQAFSSLLHSVSAIHASNIFHIFSQEQQKDLALRLLALLKIRTGSIIFGVHCGFHEEGPWGQPEFGNFKMFCHSPDSWKKLWRDLFEAEGLGERMVDVQAELQEVQSPNVAASTSDAPPSTWFMLQWSVTIL